jgi:parallel beta-helix repeat protein
VGGSGPGNYSTIQEAVNMATPGDTIYVFEGVYYESVQIDKSLSVIGEKYETTIIDGLGREDLFLLKSNGIIIEGFTFKDGHFGVYIINSTGHIIQDNRFIGTLHAISIHCGDDILIRNNNFDENPYGIRLYYCQDITVNENQFSSLKLDVFFIGSTLGECIHKWNRNFWGAPHSLPVIIRGKYRGESLTFFIFNVDWFPLSQI